MTETKFKKGDKVRPNTSKTPFPARSEWIVYDVAHDAIGVEWMIFVSNTGWARAEYFEIVP